MSHESSHEHNTDNPEIARLNLPIDYAAIYQRSQADPDFELYDVFHEIIEDSVTIHEDQYRKEGYKHSVPYTEHKSDGTPVRKVAVLNYFSYEKPARLQDITKKYLATELFNNQFLDQLGTIEDPEIFNWAISEALNPENLPEKYSSQRRPLRHSGKVIDSVNNFVIDHQDSEQIIDTLMNGVRALRTHEKTKQHLYAGFIVGMLYPVGNTSKGYIKNPLSKKLERAGKDLRGEFRHANKPSEIIARVTHGDIPLKPTDMQLEQLEDAEIYLSETPKSRHNLSRSISALKNLLDNSETAEAKKYSTLLNHLAQKDGTQSIGHIIKLANAITPTIETELGQPLRKLDHLSIDDYAIAVDRISAQATKELKEDLRKRALRSIGQCARILAEKAVEKKKAQGVITLGDLAVRYPDASTQELEIIISDLQDTASEHSSHQLYRSLRAGSRKNHAQYNAKKLGYGLVS